MNFYGLSKVIQTRYARFYAQNFGVPVTVGRTFNVIGEGMPEKLALGSFVRQIKDMPNSEELRVGNLQSKRDFLAVADVVDAYWKILLLGGPGLIYNICSGHSYSMQELVEFLIKQSGKTLSIVVEEQRVKAHDIPESYGDNAHLRRDVGWENRHDIFQVLRELVR